jgi:EpsI family protein
MTNRSFYFLIFIFLAAIASVSVIARRGQPIVVKTNLENLPMEIGGFKATEDYFPDGVYKELNADKHVYRHYRNAEEKQVDLYIGYYGTAKGGRTGHNPYACLPGAGWAIVGSREVKMMAKNKADGVGINYILARKGEVYQSVLHWYQSAGDRVLANGFQQNINSFIGRVFYNRNDGAFVEISVFCKENGIEEADREVKSFAEKVLDIMPKYWPEER